MVAVQVGPDLLLRFVGSEDQVLIRNQFAFATPAIETFSFEGAGVLSATDMQNALISEEDAQRLLSPSTAGTNPFLAPIFGRDAGGDGGTGGETGGGSGELAQTLEGVEGAVDLFEFFVPLVDDAAPLTTILGFEIGDTGDKLDIRLADGLEGTVVARQEGADTYVYFADSDVRDLDDARLLIRLEAVVVSDLTLGNFNGAPFESALGQSINGDSDPNLLMGGWGDDTIDGGSGADTLIGNEGDDLLQGRNQSDVYRFELGFGQDTVSDNGSSNTSTADVIEFGPGITAGDLIVSASSTDLFLKIASTGDTIRIVNTLSNSAYRIETVRFDDGSTLSHAELVALITAGDDSDQALYGSYDVETIDGLGGNDTILGGNGDDTIIGGTGNDLLRGNSQNDSYVFEAGFGQDIVSDDGWSNQAGNADEIVFGAGIQAADMRVAVDGNDLILTFIGSEDRIRIDETMSTATHRIESVRFDDGQVFTHTELVALAHTGTDQDQSFLGGSAAENINGAGGNDTLSGLNGNDTLIGGTGNDFLSGNSQNDTYHFELGFGQDIVSDDGWSSQAGTDIITFGAGISIDDLRVETDENDLADWWQWERFPEWSQSE